MTSTVDGFYSNFKDDQVARGIEVPLQWGGCRSLTAGYRFRMAWSPPGLSTTCRNVVRNVAAAAACQALFIRLEHPLRRTERLAWLLRPQLDSKTKRNELIFETYAGTGYSFSGPSDTLNFQTSDTGTVITSHNLDYSDPEPDFDYRARRAGVELVR